MELLGGTKERIILEQRDEEEENEERREEEGIESDELIKQLEKLKKGKVPGENGIENEAWRLMSAEIEETLHGLINKIWKKGGILEECNNELISPIYKKGEKNDTRNYRGVTLMDTAYKIYANILNERLNKEVEEKLEERQFGFREERGTIDAIFILNYVVNRELEKKKGKVFAFFADLKAAFDKVNRRKLEERMEEIGIEEQLRKRIMETYKETKNRVKVGDKRTEEFWTRYGVRQGCPMSPTLFNIYISDMEKEIKKEQAGGFVVGNEKFCTITYADDISLLAETRERCKAC